MPIAFQCPHCGHATTVADEYLGLSGPCAKCGNTITVPRVTQPAPEWSLRFVVAGLCLVALAGVLLCVAVPLGIFYFRLASTGTPSGIDHLRQIGIALHNYHDAYGSLPPAYVTDSDGKPLYSWRVLILPFLEHRDLYRRFHLDKAWDSPENIALSLENVAPFQSESNPLNRGVTNYLAIQDQACAFEKNQPTRFADILDGTSNTVIVVEDVGTTTRWSEPKDMSIARFTGCLLDPARRATGVPVLFADGSVKALAQQHAELAAKLATRAGGEVVALQP